MTIAVRKNKNAKTLGDEPAWDIALVYPRQGHWTEEDYLAFEENTGNWMIELANGRLEVLPMPSLKHQRIVKWFDRTLDDFITPRKLGETAIAPLPVRLVAGLIREPDIMYFEARRIIDAERRPLDGADLVVEVVSRGKKNRERDLRIKRREYAKAKVPEYWIIDPEIMTITVLVLSGRTYKVHGEFSSGMQATSKLLKGFTVSVDDVFAAGEGGRK